MSHVDNLSNKYLIINSIITNYLGWGLIIYYKFDIVWTVYHFAVYM